MRAPLRSILFVGVIIVGSSALALQCSDVLKDIEVALLPSGLEEFPKPTATIIEESQKTLAQLQPQMKETEAQLKALSYQQAIQEIYFQQGSYYTDGGHLWWKTTAGEVIRLVDKAEHPGRGVTAILISPDGQKVAYSTTLAGSDQHVWYIKTIERQNRHLLSDPILVRMDGFSWGKDSNTVYYSHFAKVKETLLGQEPIVVVRSRSLVTGEDRLVFDHGQRANFAIADVDGGKTLLAHRILGPGAGIKALLSLYKGVRQLDGTYLWSPLMKPNSQMGHFLGFIEKEGVQVAVLHSNFFGGTYGIIGVPVTKSQRSLYEKDVLSASRLNIVKPDSRWVLHNSQMHNGRLFLELYDPVTLESSLKVVEAMTGQTEAQMRFSDYGLRDHGSLSLPTSFNGPLVTFKYSDVLGSNRVFQYDLVQKKFEALVNPQENPYDASRVRIDVATFPSMDGVDVRALKIYPVDEHGAPVKPKFFFVKSYGMIGIKYAAESAEAQMTLARGGVYFVPDIRGGAGPNADWQVAGSRNLDLRYADMKAAVEYISQKDPMYAHYNFIPQDSVILLGRSYNGSGVLNMAARHPQLAKLFVSVVPVWDSEYQLSYGRFGIISHSDLFPQLDPQTGEMIFDEAFYKEVAKHNPAKVIQNIPAQTNLLVFTGGYDDRVDQVSLEESFVQQLRAQLGTHFLYMQKSDASHVPRWYFEELFAAIDQNW